MLRFGKKSLPKSKLQRTTSLPNPKNLTKMKMDPLKKPARKGSFFSTASKVKQQQKVTGSLGKTPVLSRSTAMRTQTTPVQKKKGFFGTSKTNSPKKTGFFGTSKTNSPKKVGFFGTSKTNSPKKTGFFGTSKTNSPKKTGFFGTSQTNSPKKVGFFGKKTTNTTSPYKKHSSGFFGSKGSKALSTMNKNRVTKTKLDSEMNELKSLFVPVVEGLRSFRKERNDAKFLNPMQPKIHQVFMKFISQASRIYNNRNTSLTIFMFYVHRAITLRTLRYALIIMNEYVLFPNNDHQNQVNQLVSLIKSIHKYCVISTNPAFFGKQVKLYHNLTGGKLLLQALPPQRRSALRGSIESFRSNRLLKTQMNRVGSPFITDRIARDIISKIDSAPNFIEYRKSLGGVPSNVTTLPSNMQTKYKFDKSKFDDHRRKMQKALFAKYKKQGVPNPKHAKNRSQPKLLYDNQSVSRYVQPLLQKSLAHYKSQFENSRKSYIKQEGSKQQQFYKDKGKMVLDFNRQQRKQNKKSVKAKSLWSRGSKKAVNIQK